MNTVLNVYYRLMDNAGYWSVLILTFLAAALVVIGIYLLITRKTLV